jgi:hypothetical protein
MSAPARYRGKPLLKLLECYVLWTIDHLSEADSHMLTQMTPKLESVYGVNGDWRQIIVAVMNLPPNMPELIRNMWARNTEIARRAGTALTPQQFAEMFVDKNLAS